MHGLNLWINQSYQWKFNETWWQ